MRKITARKGRAGAHRLLGRTVRRGDKSVDPGILHQQEIEHRREKLRIARPRGQIGRGQPRRAEEDLQEIVLPRQPAQRLQSKRFRLVPAHFPPAFRHIRETHS